MDFSKRSFSRTLQNFPGPSRTLQTSPGCSERCCCEDRGGDGEGTEGGSWEKAPLCSQRGADGSARHKSQTIYKSSKTNQKITSPKSKCRTNLLLSVRSEKTKAECLQDGQTQTDAVSPLNKDLKTETRRPVRVLMLLSSPSGNFLL